MQRSCKIRSFVLIVVSVLVIAVGAVIPSLFAYGGIPFDTRAEQLRVYVDDTYVDYNVPYWQLKEVWIAVSGNWDNVPTFARKWQKDNLGGDHHAYGLALNEFGDVYKYAGFQLSWPDGQGGTAGKPEWDGWANLPLYAGFDWQEGPGPYCFAKVGNAERLCGLGLPYTLPFGTLSALGGVHVSYFGVWQETMPQEPTPVPTPSEWIPCYLKIGPITLQVELKQR